MEVFLASNENVFLLSPIYYLYFICNIILHYVIHTIFVVLLREKLGGFTLQYSVDSSITLHLIINHKLHDKSEVSLVMP